MKNIYKHFFLMITFITYQENSYTADLASYTTTSNVLSQPSNSRSNIQNTTRTLDNTQNTNRIISHSVEPSVNFNSSSISAMQYFNENMKKNQTTYKNIQNLMLGAPIDSIESIINQSKIALDKITSTDNNKQMVQDALTSTLRTLDGAIADAKFDANQNATTLSYLNPINYIYGNSVEKELNNMKKMVQHRLSQDELLTNQQELIKTASNYGYLGAKVTTGAVALMAAMYAGMHHKEIKDSMHDFINYRTIGDYMMNAADAVKASAPAIAQAAAEGATSVAQAAV